MRVAHAAATSATWHSTLSSSPLRCGALALSPSISATTRDSLDWGEAREEGRAGEGCRPGQQVLFDKGARVSARQGAGELISGKTPAQRIATSSPGPPAVASYLPSTRPPCPHRTCALASSSPTAPGSSTAGRYRPDSRSWGPFAKREYTRKYTGVVGQYVGFVPMHTHSQPTRDG